MQRAALFGRTTILLVVLGVALIVGGGGSPSPTSELIVELTAALALGLWVATTSADQPLFSVSRRVLAAVGLLLAIPLVQLVPFPPAVWHAFPGRESARAALALIGADDTWQPLSLAPQRTLAAFLAMIPPAFVFLATASLPRRGRAAAIACVAGIALLSMIVGAAQLSAGGSSAVNPYGNLSHHLLGFQANHNSTADVLLIGMIACVAALREWSDLRDRAEVATPRAGWLALGLCALLLLACALTASRAGLALAPLALGACAILARRWFGRASFARRIRPAIVVGLAAGVVALVAVIVWTNPVLAAIVARFDFAGEARPELWRDTLFAIRASFPVGTGMGTFMPVFMAAERLEIVIPAVTNRAHNDVLEFVLETGALGIAVLGWLAVALVVAVVRGLKVPPAGSRAQVLFAGASLALVALHSQVDYPLRSLSLAVLASVCAGVLAPIGARGRLA